MRSTTTPGTWCRLTWSVVVSTVTRTTPSLLSQHHAVVPSNSTSTTRRRSASKIIKYLSLINHHFSSSHSTTSLHSSGCYEAMELFLKSKMGVLGGITAATAVLQISIISAAAVLVSKWDKPSSCYPCY